jgi:hypothetical protein
MDDDEQDKIISGTTKTTLTLAGALAASHGHGDIVVMLSLLKDFAPDAATQVAQYARRQFRERFPALVAGVEETSGLSVNEAVATENAAESWFEAYRRMMNTPEPFAAHALGRMAGMYIRDDRRPDQFFRAAGRVIEELGPDEYDGLQRILAAAGTNGQQTFSQHIELSLNSNPASGSVEGGGAQVFYKKGSESWLGLKDERGYVEKTPGMLRVFFLLRSHGLAAEVPGATTYNIKAVSGELISLDLGKIGAQLREILVPRGE